MTHTPHYNFRVYDKKRKCFVPWTGFFHNLPAAIEWLRLFGEYWRGNGRIIVLFLGINKVKPEISNKESWMRRR